MSTFNIRYGGQIESLSEGSNFNDNYGTAKLNIKVNSTSTLKLGLTTNTNAQEYCHFSIRIGGKTAYIGRVTSGYSRQTLSYNGQASSWTSSKEGYSLASSKTGYTDEYAGSATGTRNVAGSTQYYTSTISRSVIATSFKIVTTGQETYTSTRNGEWSYGKSSVEPILSTITNSTGSTATYATTSERLSTPWYSFSVQVSEDDYRSEYSTISRVWPALGAKKTLTISRTRQLKYSREIQRLSIRGTDYKGVYDDYKSYTKLTSYSQAFDDWTTYQATTTRRISATTTSNVTTGSTAGAWVTVKKDADNWADDTEILAWDRKYSDFTMTVIHTYTSKQTQNGSVYSTAKTSYNTRQTRAGYNTWGNYTAPEPIQTKYLYETTYIYSISTCEKYTHTDYLTDTEILYETRYTTSYTNRIVSVSQTMHNMNI